MIVAIDGPAGAGKSTVARRLAERLGFRYLDTGAMYRALTWLALQRGVPLEDESALERLARAEPVTFDGDRVLIAGEDVTTAIRQREIDHSVPSVARQQPVRAVMRQRQRELAAEGDAVIEGRDIGAVVVPDSEVKVYLVADQGERAEAAQRGAPGRRRRRPRPRPARARRERQRADAQGRRRRSRSTRRTSPWTRWSTSWRSACAHCSGREPRRRRLGRGPADARLGGATAGQPAQLRRGARAARGRRRARVQPLQLDRPARLRRHVPTHGLLHGQGQAHGVPGLGQLMRSFGTFAVRRGESDRDAVRRMREVVREGHALGLFVEGTRQLSGEPGEVKPGASMAALQEDVPVVPAAIYGTHGWKPGLGRRRRSPSPGGSRSASTASRAPRAATAKRRASSSARSGGSGNSWARCTKPGRGRRTQCRRAVRSPPRPRHGGGEEHGGEGVPGEPPLAGVVAIVGFPNVGKSTLDQPADRVACGRRPRDARRHARSQGARLEWGRTRFLLIDTGGVDVVDPSPLARSIVDQARAAVDEADLVLFVTDARVGVTPGDEELADLLRRSGKPVLVVANKVDDPVHEAGAAELNRLGSASR